MSKLTDQLREIKIFNNYGIIDEGMPMIVLGRYGVTIYIKGRVFKNQPWYADGGLVFPYCGIKDRRSAYEKALKKVSDLFPEITMVKSPFGGLDYIPEHCLLKVKQKITEKEKNK